MHVLNDSLFGNGIYAMVLTRTEFTNPNVINYLNEAGYSETNILLDIYGYNVEKEDFRYQNKPIPEYRVLNLTPDILVAELWHITDSLCGTSHDIHEFPRKNLNLTPKSYINDTSFATTKSEWVQDLMGVVIDPDPEIINKIAREASETYASYFTRRRKE